MVHTHRAEEILWHNMQLHGAIDLGPIIRVPDAALALPEVAQVVGAKAHYRDQGGRHTVRTTGAEAGERTACRGNEVIEVGKP